MAYPNLKQSVWLVVLFFLFSMVVGLPFGVLGAILDRSLFKSPYVIQFLILASFILTVMYAYRRTDRTWSDILLLKPVSWQLYLPLGVCIVGLAIVGSDLGNLFRQLIPVPENVQDLFGGPARRETPYLFTFFAMVVQAPIALRKSSSEALYWAACWLTERGIGPLSGRRCCSLYRTCTRGDIPRL